MVKNVKKRDGRIVDFDIFRIENAIKKAFIATEERNGRIAKKLAREVEKKLKKKFKKNIPTVEDIQDTVEEVLINRGFARVAKAYILYRRERERVREEKKKILEKSTIDEVEKKLSINALRVLKARYLRKDENGKLLETPKEMFERVAINVGIVDILYDKRVYNKNGNEHVNIVNSINKNVEGKLKIGRYKLNKYHVETLLRTFNKFAKEGKIRIKWNKLIKMLKHGEFDEYEKNIEKYYNVMINLKFLPNTPTLANFGNSLGMGSACFVLNIEDNMESIMETLKRAAFIFKAGGGVGYNFSKIRPEGDYVKSTHGIASGPISFMELFDKMTDVIKQGGIRRGANMGIMNINHADIEKFINAKEGNKTLKNFNISVLIFPEFWEYYEKNKPYPLINPRTGKVVKTVNARRLFDMIAYQAWAYAEPGIIFFDNINNYNPFLKSLGAIYSTNPCGEVPLYPFESCNLGSINLYAFVKKRGKDVIFDWDELKEIVQISVRFLDNVIDANNYPLPEIDNATRKTRKIGIGIMGLADLFFELKIPYNSKEAIDFIDTLAQFINYHSKLESIKIAEERGKMPYYEKSFYKDGKLPFSGFYEKGRWKFDWKYVSNLIKKKGIRNGYTTVIAPTGSISMIAGCSSGIEPVFSLIYKKEVAIGTFYYINRVFEECMKKLGIFDEQLIRDVNENNGSIQKIKYIPNDLKKIFVTAMDINIEDHIKVLATFQKWVDGSISKTNNMKEKASIDDVKKAFILAYKLGCKDITIYRNKSLKKQVYITPNEKHSKTDNDLCPECKTILVHSENCITCPACGWSACTT